MDMRKSDNLFTEGSDNLTNKTSLGNFLTMSRILQNGNIAQTMDRLLNIYRPEDGIAAYERILKTIFIIPESFDYNTLQQLISMVPLPKYASKEAISEVIYKTTGIINTSVPLHSNTNIMAEENYCRRILGGSGSMIKNQNVLINANPETVKSGIEYLSAAEYKNSELTPSVSEVFLGFPKNEIPMIHTHVRNTNHLYNTLDYNSSCLQACSENRKSFASNIGQPIETSRLRPHFKFNWQRTPRLLYKNNCYHVPSSYQKAFIKPPDNKYIQIPFTKITGCDQCDLENVPRVMHQEPDKTQCSNAAQANKVYDIRKMEEKAGSNKREQSFPEADARRDYYRILHAKNNGEDSKKYNNGIVNRNKQVFGTELSKHFEEELKVKQRAIQDDIYKMDCVNWEEENQETSADVDDEESVIGNSLLESLTVSENLRASLKNFLRRVEEGVRVEFPSFPGTSSEYIYTESEVETPTCSISEIVEEDLENDNALECSIMNIDDNARPEEDQNTESPGKKKKITRSQINNSLKLLQNDASQSYIFENIADCDSEEVDLLKKRANEDEESLPHMSTTKQTKQSDDNTLQQAASITELATYKKQCYDTLLSIQKAKVAVASSLTMPSMESSTRYDPYYSNYLYQQQQQLLRQQQQLSVSPQFAVHTMTQPGLSNMHNVPYIWLGYNNWRHPLTRPLRCQRQSPCPYLRNKDRWTQHSRTRDGQRCASDANKDIKQNVQRKKLEDIVGKLKEAENGSAHI